MVVAHALAIGLVRRVGRGERGIPVRQPARGDVERGPALVDQGVLRHGRRPGAQVEGEAPQHLVLVDGLGLRTGSGHGSGAAIGLGLGPRTDEQSGEQQKAEMSATK